MLLVVGFHYIYVINCRVPSGGGSPPLQMHGDGSSSPQRWAVGVALKMKKKISVGVENHPTGLAWYRMCTSMPSIFEAS